MGKNGSHGTLLILLAAILWGTTGTSQALAPHGAHPMAVGALRLAVGGGTLLLIALFSGKVTRQCFRQPRITLLASLLVATYQLAFFEAVVMTGVAVGTMVGIGSGPLFAGLFAFLVHAERPDRRWLIATLLAITGLLVLFIPAPGSVSQVSSTGVLMALVAGASYAGYTLAIKRLLPGNSPDAVIAVVFTGGGMLLAPFLFRSDLRWTLEPGGLLVILHLGLVTTALAYILFARGLRSVPAVHAVTLSLAEPLTAATLGIIVLKERLTFTAAFGMTLVLAGLVILGYGAAQKQH
ncbi:MAG: EamA family transporter [Desulfuromonadaceae bacterium]|nr:EamA family transporter [Desulfuromonadaceae bacterium]